MKYTVTFILLFLFMQLFAHGQDCNNVVVDSWSVSYSLPNDKWILIKSDINPENMLYIYIRSSDQDKKTGIASMAVVGELIPADIDVIAYSIKLRENTSYTVLQVYSPEDKLFDVTNCIGYLAEHVDVKGKHHRYMILHLINKNKGIQVVMETIAENFDKLEPEFKAIIKSLKIIK